ncbi:DEAD/DEAH box helicase [Corynebacterium sp. HMSC062E11]|uniref:DEAD/DEAH box helicase n=1 Tax=unclassified Corynebacterium TaxID=2624378 RepID=UPI0008A19CAC|nr:MULTISPECIES: RNA helicase [unclassified Corynebacterium]MDK6807305.1 RNA helicase [Corynebacterium aurimucosum]NJJ83590.1 RNA helicase [Corynebacterium aurimucosum]OFK25883.1 DEAD/DEAH box helicase [Corynebacterium sp. HMSC062E11]OFL61422.1 DEAD/DEAH box helicase [Corynebacterium sp. HMSC065D07]OFP73185.1 DEAD/DEAH box helicase [Corynebacterium sp. HMSC078C09]
MTLTHLDEFTQALPYSLDDFQIEGCQAVEAGHGVLVCAPTGAGKTVVGEFAVSLALRQGTRCFYTTPIKALSNQKYHDLVEAHGEDAVGLLTGDVSINSSADILVMTTEVLRNMIYAGSGALDRLTHVVMDEIHFLADASRGAVWEEVILNLEEHVSIIGLSATVSNSEEFGRWLTTVRGDTKVIVTDKRPVPLDQWMMVGRKIYPLFEPDSGGQVNAELARRIQRLEAGDSDNGRADYAQNRASFRARARHKGGGRNDRNKDRRSGAPRAQDRYRPLGRPEVLKELQSMEMLPAITFIFSRAGCDGALYQCLRSRMVLTSQEETAEIKAIVDKGVEGIPEEDLKVLDFKRWREALSRGFAAHHAGMLPAFRHIVEELFVKGLVRAVFATETLALGINMPARTVVLEKLVKFNGEAHVDLTPGQYTQLTGRAGRRGIDTLGNAVVQWAPAMDPTAVAGLASTRTYPLISTFEPGYNMAINLLGMLGFDDSLRLLEKSFAQFQADGSVVEETREIERAEHRVRELRAQLDQAVDNLAPPTIDGEDPAEILMDYMRLRRALTEEEKSARASKKEERSKEVAAVLARLQVGEVIAIATKKRPTLAVVITPANQTADPRPWVTTETGWSGRIDAAGIDNPPIVVGHMKLPRAAQKNPRRHTKYVQDAFKRDYYKRPKKMRTEPRNRPNKKIAQLRDALREHPVHNWPATDREQLAGVAQKLARRERELHKLEAKVERATDTLGRTFERIVDLLAEMDYVEFEGYGEDREPVITDEGERLAKIHSESDLLVAQCLKRGIWNDLDPAELAGVASLCVFENRKATRGEPGAASDDMADAMNATWRIYTELVSDEKRHNLPQTREPEPAFALAIHQWTAGAPLAYCMAAANESGAELTPGDFVRWCRQVIDLLQQVAKTGYEEEIRRNARRAIDAIQRGVVAIGA